MQQGPSGPPDVAGTSGHIHPPASPSEQQQQQEQQQASKREASMREPSDREANGNYWVKNEDQTCANGQHNHENGHGHRNEHPFVHHRPKVEAPNGFSPHPNIQAYPTNHSQSLEQVVPQQNEHQSFDKFAPNQERRWVSTVHDPYHHHYHQQSNGDAQQPYYYQQQLPGSTWPPQSPTMPPTALAIDDSSNTAGQLSPDASEWHLVWQSCDDRPTQQQHVVEQQHYQYHPYGHQYHPAAYQNAVPPHMHNNNASVQQHVEHDNNFVQHSPKSNLESVPESAQLRSRGSIGGRTSSSSSSRKSRRTSLEVFLSHVRIGNDSNGNRHVDASGIISKACFEDWLSTRRKMPKHPEEAFRKTINSHITISDRASMAFDPDVERSLLAALRIKRVWPCFVGRFYRDTGLPVNIGLKGVRTRGHHERGHVVAVSACESDSGPTTTSGGLKRLSSGEIKSPKRT